MKTTDPQDEIFPIVNEEDKVVGKISRKEAHESPHIIHRASAVLVFDKKGKLLIQKRSLTKDTAAGCWAYSVGGHVGYGENYLAVAVRETQEELGIIASPKNLQPLGKLITVAPWEKEMIKVYKLSLKETPMLHPSPEEVSAVKFVDMETLREMIRTQKWTPSSIQVIDEFILKN